MKRILKSIRNFFRGPMGHAGVPGINGEEPERYLKSLPGYDLKRTKTLKIIKGEILWD